MHRLLILSVSLLITAPMGPAAQIASAQQTDSTQTVNAEQTLHSQPTGVLNRTESAANVGNLEVGIGGIYRLGYWTAIRLAAGQQPRPQAAVQTVQTLDGDGVRVRYRQAAADLGERSADDSAGWSYAVPGAVAAPLRLSGHGDRLLWQGRFPGQPIDPATRWVVVIGDTLGVESIGGSALLGREAAVAVAQVAAAGDLPDRAAGWEGVDLLIINAPGTEILSQLDPQRVAAIAAWTARGGRLFVGLGKEGAAMLNAAPWLAELIDLPLRAAPIRLDPAELENYTSSTSPLPTLDGYELPARGGRTLIAGRTAARQPARLAIERLVGLGRVVITAFAADSPQMADWPQRTALIARMHPGLLDVDTQRRREARSVAAVAYDDLAGQVRAALDRFDSHRRTPFSIVSLILLLLVALIGPLDYLLVNRVFGRPLLGWISFPLSVLLVSVLILVLHGRGGSTTSAQDATAGDAAAPAVRSNRIEIIDINAVSAEPFGRGMSLTHLSSPVAASIDLDFEALPELYDSSQQTTARSAAPPEPLTGPYGYPSTTFGGISIAGEDRGLPPYTIELQAIAPQYLLGGKDALAGGPVGFPIPPSGSKGWMSRWSFRPALGETTGLSQRRGSELLSGSITNPLNIDLLNGVLVYNNWAYLLPTRFRSGQKIDSIDSLRQKNFRWYLTRREALESSSRLDAWNVQMHDDLERLTEMLMFESAAGGRDYTGLNNRPLAGLDLSHVLAHGHAILYGRLPTAVLQTQVPEERATVSAVRIILDVAPATLRGR